MIPNSFTPERREVFFQVLGPRGDLLAEAGSRSSRH
jgi:hypothetical protein